MSTIFADNFKNTSGGDPVNINEVKTDKITGKTTAGSIPVQGEGSATTNLQQGLAKSWVNFDGTGTPAARDSLNFASITDNGTGYYTIVFTNAMNNDDYCRSGSVGENANTGANRILGIRLPATTGFNVATYNTSGGINDNADICCLAHGDLA